METLEKTPRTTLRRMPARGTYDEDRINAILDEGLVCHVSVVAEGRPISIPTNYVRDGNHLLFHGSAASRMMKLLGAGAEACVCVTLVDGFVLARSAFHHSMNYRCVILYGTGKTLEGEDKRAAMDRFVDRLIPGRAAACREPSARELDATTVIAFPILEASAKLRTGPPIDDEDDHGLGYWAGILPIRTIIGEPIPDPTLNPSIEVPAHVRARMTASRSLSMKTACERCGRAAPADRTAYICSYECTYCSRCEEALEGVCPNCGGELLQRPRRRMA